MKKKILGALLCILLLCAALTVTAFAADIASGSGWRIDGGGCLHLTGAVHNASDPWTNNSPFYPYADQITSAVAETGSSIDNG